MDHFLNYESVYGCVVYKLDCLAFELEDNPTDKIILSLLQVRLC